MRGRWLTPNELPGTTKCWAISIPDSVDFFAILKGAIDELRFSSNFEEFGSLSPSEVADAFAVAFDTIGVCTGGSRMTGEVIAYATSDAPDGTLACDGATYLRVDYPNLYSVLASAFIQDSDHFSVPDLRGRSIIGIGTGAGLTARAMNDDGGEETHGLSVSELPAHSHKRNPGGSAEFTLLYDFSVSDNAWLSGSAKTILPTDTGETGGDTAHNTMHPFLALGYAIVT